MDRSVDYLVRLFGPAIVLVPEGAEFPLSRLENSNNANRDNGVGHGVPSTRSIAKGFKGGRWRQTAVGFVAVREGIPLAARVWKLPILC